jgi:hypothetical protein
MVHNPTQCREGSPARPERSSGETGLLKPFKSPVPACGGLDCNQPAKQETSRKDWVQLSLF